MAFIDHDPNQKMTAKVRERKPHEYGIGQPENLVRVQRSDGKHKETYVQKAKRGSK